MTSTANLKGMITPKMKYIVIGESGFEAMAIIGQAEDLQSAAQIAKTALYSGAKFWDAMKSEMTAISGATIYERAGEAIVHVEIKVMAKAEAVLA